MTTMYVIQDGGVFYRTSPEGDIEQMIAQSAMVANDGDLDGAKLARAWFVDAARRGGYTVKFI